jgi:hypothetical protein
MSLILDGIEYQAGEAFDIARDMADFINKYCTTHNVLNSKGERVRVDVNDASVLWLILFANGYRDSIIEKMVYSAALNFNLALCSDEQLLNLAQIARTERGKPSPTTVVLSIEAVGGDAHITKSSTASILTKDVELLFSPAYEQTIPAGSVRPVIFIADKTGPFPVPENAFTNFDQPVQNARILSSAEGSPGSLWEPLTSLRRRLNVNNKSITDAESAKNAISSLSGVSNCSIFVNLDPFDPLVINGVSVPPRKSIVFINGYNEDIPRQYFKYMSLLTVGADMDNSVPLSYTTLSGQSIPFFYFTPSFRDVFIKVTIDILPTESRIANIQNILLTLNGSKDIGANLTAADVFHAFQNSQTDYNLLGVTLSMDGLSWSISSAIAHNQLFAITRDKIFIELWEEIQ